MSSAPERRRNSPLQRDYDPLAAFLSYLIPGLGQIHQGRVLKGLLFFVCILTLFYYGAFLGSWSNVYIPDNPPTAEQLENPPQDNRGAPIKPSRFARLPNNLWNRPQYVLQFWVGIASWPAVFQYASYDPMREKGPIFGAYQRFPYEERGNQPSDPVGDDPDARAAVRQKERVKAAVALKDYKGKTLNELQSEGDKTWDLGWVFTVIAGALNIMVIYDALAGPALIVVPPEKESFA